MDTSNSFAGRHADYAFFLAHTDEPVRCRSVLLRALEGVPPGRVRWLDFGCGGGEFLEGVLRGWNRKADEVSLTLVDVDEAARTGAVRRLAPWAGSVTAGETVPGEGRFEVVTSNHALYYVENLSETLDGLVRGLSEGGLGVWTLGGCGNQLCRLWLAMFEEAGERLPFYLAEDVGRWLAASDLEWREEPVGSVLRFPDTRINRARVARFLFGPRLERFGLERVQEAFGAWQSGEEIVMESQDACFVVGGG
ncbi:MAG: class I SAM-dependent methyltransferase [Verrucomicrobiia bacterium]